MGRIAEETIQRVADANDIVEVIQNYFPLKRAGTSFRALCPFHTEKSPSFHVNPQRQSYHCFGCGAGGSVIRFVMEYEHMDFPSAVKHLAQRAGVPIVEEEGSAEEDQRHALRKRLLGMHAEAAAWFHHQLLRSPSAQIARDYLKSRGINGEVAKNWQLGFAPDSWDALTDFLREKKFSMQDIAQSGLVSSRDDDNADAQNTKFYARFRGRVMFPIRNDYGEVIGFSGRVLDANAKTAKYVNSPETPLFTKGKVLYGLDKSKRDLIAEKLAIVCEGQLDLISAFESGVRNVIAPQGTAFTNDQARVLQRFVETVVLCFDSDRAGQEAVTRSLPALLECGLSVRVANLPEGEDPDSLIRSKGPEAFRAIIEKAKDFFDYAVESLLAKGALENPDLKSKGARRLGPYVAMIKEPMLREAVTTRICARLNITPAAFKSTLKAPAPSPSGTPENPEVKPPVRLSAGIEILCRLALTDPPTRDWLATQTSPPITQLGQGSVLLEKILRHPYSLEEQAALSSFLTSLPPEEESALTALNLEYQTPQALQMAQDSWRGLAANLLKAEREAASAQLRQSGLTKDQQEVLQKQILDLQSRLNDLSTPFPQASADI